MLIMLTKNLAITLVLFSFMSIALAGNQREESLAAEVRSSLHSSIINPIQPHLVFATQRQADRWLSMMSQRLIPWVHDDFMRKRLLTIIQYEAVRAGLDPQMLLSIITVESRFNRYAISTAGAMGIMQVMPFWVKQIGLPAQNLLNISTNIRYGCTILRHYLQIEHGDMYYALGRYNGSRGKSFYPNLVYNAYYKYWYF